jgi:hypothetical protein
MVQGRDDPGELAAGGCVVWWHWLS